MGLCLYMLCICLTFFGNKLTVNPDLCYLFITTGAWSWTVPEFQHLRIRCLLGGRPEFLASACCSAYPSWFHDTLDAIVSNWQQKFTILYNYDRLFVVSIDCCCCGSDWTRFNCFTFWFWFSTDGPVRDKKSEKRSNNFISLLWHSVT